MIAILGATGPTGIHLAAILRERGHPVRVVARDANRLRAAFPDQAIENVAADLEKPDATRRAIEGCDLVYDCVGLPGDQMHLHPVIAGNIARAVCATSVRCVQVSSYWGYLPLTRSPINESHPRADGTPWIRLRREAEDILLAAGAAILHLPDFYGPRVHTSTLQNTLMEAARGKTINWLGDAGTAREYIFVPDAMQIAADIGKRTEAFGEHWILPGAGPLTGNALAEIASRHLGRPVKLRSAGLTMLRVASLFSKDLRGLMQIAPDYMKPIAFDAAKLERLLGKPRMTSYESGIATTLDSIPNTQ